MWKEVIPVLGYKYCLTPNTYYPDESSLLQLLFVEMATSASCFAIAVILLLLTHPVSAQLFNPQTNGLGAGDATAIIIPSIHLYNLFSVTDFVCVNVLPFTWFCLCECTTLYDLHLSITVYSKLASPRNNTSSTICLILTFRKLATKYNSSCYYELYFYMQSDSSGVKWILYSFSNLELKKSLVNYTLVTLSSN